MIRGNEMAIDLALEVLAVMKPNQPVSQLEVSVWCDAAREVLGLQTQPFRQQDLFYLEHRALKKLLKPARQLRAAMEAITQ